MNYLDDPNRDKDIILQMTDIRVWEKEEETLTNFNLILKKGEIHAVIGRFYTDIKAVRDIFSLPRDVKVDGAVLIDGKFLSREAFAQNEIYIIKDGDVLINGFSVLDNVFLKEKQYYMLPRRIYRRKLEGLCGKFGIDIPIEADVRKLGIGEGILIELLKAYLDKPKLCLLNDCLNFLSEKQQKIALQIIKALQGEAGTAILFLTTRYEDVLKLAEKITVISNKKVNGQFTIQEAQENPQKLIYRISGWNTADEDVGNGFRDILALLLEEQHAIESTEEIKNVLELIVGSIKNVASCQFCSIVLLDEYLQNYIVVGNQGQITDAVLEFAKRKGQLPVNQVFDLDLADQEIVLPESKKLRHIFYSSVRIAGEMAAFIIVGFETLQNQVIEKKKILQNFAKEISITMETSKMVGKSVLLQESHHRIKNNLQIIVNLLYMQKIDLLYGNGDVKAAFDKIINQVKSIAIIHDLLSKEEQNRSMVNLKEIIQEVVSFYQFENIRFELELDDITIPYNNAATLSLLVNELISNCIKHAFPPKFKGEKRVDILCAVTDDKLKITISDNGVGFPGDMRSMRKGIGTNIISSTVQKMNGTITQENQEGATTTIILHKNSIYE